MQEGGLVSLGETGLPISDPTRSGFLGKIVVTARFGEDETVRGRLGRGVSESFGCCLVGFQLGGCGIG